MDAAITAQSFSFEEGDEQAFNSHLQWLKSIWVELKSPTLRADESTAPFLVKLDRTIGAAISAAQTDWRTSALAIGKARDELDVLLNEIAVAAKEDLASLA